MPSPQGVSWIRKATVPLTAVAVSAVIGPGFIAHQMSAASTTTRNTPDGRPTPMWWSAN